MTIEHLHTSSRLLQFSCSLEVLIDHVLKFDSFAIWNVDLDFIFFARNYIIYILHCHFHFCRIIKFIILEIAFEPYRKICTVLHFCFWWQKSAFVKCQNYWKLSTCVKYEPRWYFISSSIYYVDWDLKLKLETRQTLEINYHLGSCHHIIIHWIIWNISNDVGVLRW